MCDIFFLLICIYFTIVNSLIHAGFFWFITSKNSIQLLSPVWERWDTYVGQDGVGTRSYPLSCYSVCIEIAFNINYFFIVQFQKQ